MGWKICTFYNNNKSLVRFCALICSFISTYSIFFFLIFLSPTPAYPLQIQVTFHLDIFFSLLHNCLRKKVAVLLTWKEKQSLCTKLLELVFKLSTCFSNYFFYPKHYMHAQTLQVQLTYTASDPREIKLIHFSKVRRKLSYLSIKGKQILFYLFGLCILCPQHPQAI